MPRSHAERFWTLLLVVLVPLGAAGCSSTAEEVPPEGDVQSVAQPSGEEASPRVPADGATTEAPPADEVNPPQTQQASGGEPRHTNRLAKETSPYLLLHAHNPVDWYPWGEEALAKAKEEGKPIFLSVGYSSCYWCHVMERESFMDEEIAKFLNENFVCIKIDREERPDIDNIYMTSLHMLGRRGGWPLSMFLTSQGKPFFGGTYWPARDGDRDAAMGFLSVAKLVAETWDENREALQADADRLTAAVSRQLRGSKPIDVGELEHTMVERVWEDLRDDYDPTWGGFGYNEITPRQPKFPEPSNLLFLIDRIERQDIEDWEAARTMLTTTLDKMAQGGIYDHLGGGFHRYSTDRYWHIPHFEKMLYDNGQLASVYARAYKLTGNEEYMYVVIRVLAFVQREMMNQAGAFYSALDAETDAEEGKYYRWTKEELDELLTTDEDGLFRSTYNLDGEPNFEDEYYVPMLAKSLTEHADAGRGELDIFLQMLYPAREILFKARQNRERPLTDTKILTSWNGLMIRGFADAGRLLENEEQIQAAERAADFLLDNLRTKDGRLLRTHTADKAKLNAYLDDYAFLVDGLIALHQATGKEKWLTAARQLTDKQIELFWDDRDGGFFYTSDDHEELIARAKDPVDTVIPSGNSVSAGNLLYLAKETGDAAYREKARQTILSSAVYLRTSPSSVPHMAVQLAEYLATEENSP